MGGRELGNHSQQFQVVPASRFQHGPKRSPSSIDVNGLGAASCLPCRRLLALTPGHLAKNKENGRSAEPPEEKPRPPLPHGPLPPGSPGSPRCLQAERLAKAWPSTVTSTTQQVWGSNMPGLRRRSRTEHCIPTSRRSFVNLLSPLPLLESRAIVPTNWTAVQSQQHALRMLRCNDHVKDICPMP